MKFGTTLRLLAVVCVLGLVVWRVETRSRERAESARHETRVLRIDANHLDFLELQNASLHVVLAGRDGAWFLEAPVRGRAAKAEIDRILSVLESLPVLETVTGEERRERDLSLADYGLLEPHTRLAVAGPGGHVEIAVGIDAPLGDGVYVQRAGDDCVIGTARAVLDVVPGSIEILRDRTLIHGDIAGTSRIEIERPGAGFIQLVRVDGSWRLQQPLSARAEQTRVTMLLSGLYAAQVSRFVWDPVSPAASAVEAGADAGGRFELYGLAGDAAAARIRIWASGDEVGRELVLGKPVDAEQKEIYARCRDDDSVYAVDAALLGLVSVTATDLRAHDLFTVDPSRVRYASFGQGDRKVVMEKRSDSGWTIVEPVEWKADDELVGDVVRRIVGLRAQRFRPPQTNDLAEGLDPTSLAITLGPQAPSIGSDGATTEAPRTECLLVGEKQAASETIPARFKGGPDVFDLLAVDVARLGVTGMDPLAYRDRTMLALPPQSVTRIARVKGGAEQAIARGEGASWTAALPTNGLVSGPAVDSILFHAANLRARYIESGIDGGVGAYGLDQPRLVLTFGLTGEKGIQKSLLVGREAGDGNGVFAMVQGQDVVFVVDGSVVDQMAGDIVQPAPPGKPDVP